MLDTVNVPHGGKEDLIMDFTNPVIRGVSVFPADPSRLGMMAKIVFE
jgi:suppressor of ftsI